jgi:UDP-N-acetylmuramate dehydrogenase
MFLDDKAKKWLTTHFKENVTFGEPMSRHTSLRVGGPSEAYVVPESRQELIALVKWSCENGFPYLIVGDGTNLLVKDRGIPGIVIALKKCLNEISIRSEETDGVMVRAMAGARLSALCAFALKKGFKGLNFALGIPGTVGAAIMMNAGTAYGWMASALNAVTVLMSSGNLQSVKREALTFSYRKLSWAPGDSRNNLGRPVIIEGDFSLFPADPKQLKKEADTILKDRKKKQPTAMPSAGCFFKNPETGKTAGELIDLAGFKGHKLGGAAVSSRHANFIINKGNASAADIITLMELIQKTVAEKFNIKMEAEVNIVGK